MQQVVGERIFAGVVERGGVVAHDQAFAQQQRQGVDRARVDGPERPIPEHVPHHRRLLQRTALARCERVQPGLQHAGQRRRHASTEQLVGQHAPAVGLGHDDAVVDQHLHQFFHVERVAFGTTGEQRPQRHGHRGQPIEQPACQLVAGRLVERPEFELGRAVDVVGPVGPVRFALEQRRARQQQQQQRRAVILGQQVAHEVQCAAIRPMQVVQHHDDRSACGEAAQAQRGGFECAVPEFTLVAQHLLDERAGREVESYELADEVDRRFALVGEQRYQPVDQFAARHFGGFSLADLELAHQHVAQQSVGMLAAARMGTPEQQPARLPAQALLELGEQPALAQARFGNDHDAACAPLGHGGVECRVQCAEFGFAPDHRGVHTLDAARRHAKRLRLRTFDEVAAQRSLDALDADRRLLGDVELPAHVAVGVVTDTQPARRRALFHAGGDVDGGAADAALGVDPAAEQHRAGVHTSAHVEVGHAVARAHCRGLVPRFLDDSQARADSALDVVFTRLLGAERGEHAVAGVLKHAPVMQFHDRGEAFERAVHHGMDVLRTQLLTDRCGADDVDEQHRHLLELLLWRLSLPRLQRREFAPQWGERRIDDRVAENPTLRFERGDGGGDLFGRVLHAVSLLHWRRGECETGPRAASSAPRRQPPGTVPRLFGARRKSKSTP